MRGLGMLIALDALDLAKRASHGPGRSGVARTSSLGPDGELDDGLTGGDFETRMAAWRAWARRRDLAGPAPVVRQNPRQRRAPGGSVTTG
jgi:hypothetical protein